MVIVNWNGKHLLADCLSSLQIQRFRDFETILVDNGSTDGSIEWVRAEYPDVQLVPLPENRGFCGGNNAGIRLARGDYVVLLNNDTEVDADWLGALVRHIQSDASIGACDSKILYFDRREIIWSAGAALTIAGSANFRGQGQQGADFTEPAEVFSAVACSAIYPRRVLDEIGLLDEDFFVGYEDVDWSFRARLRGYRIVNVPASLVYHKVSATHGYNSATYVYHGQRNVTVLFLKDMPDPLLLKYAALHLIYALGSFVYFARQGRAGAFLGAKWAALGSWGRLWAKRRETQQRRTVPAQAIDAWLSRNWLSPKIRKFTA